MGKPKYILLVRHGESQGNCDKSVNRFTPNHTVDLTEKGHYQATAAGLVLRQFLQQECFDTKLPGNKNPRSIMFYTSPYLRARQTCNNIIEGIKDLPGVEYGIHEEARMREQDFGNFQSTPEEMEKIWEERAHYGHFFYRIPHGESAADVYDRIASFNESLFRQFQQDDFPNILVLVTHGIWARVFLMKWFRWSYEEFESLKNIPHCQYLIMKRHEHGKFFLKTRLLTWDDVDEDDIDDQIVKEVGDEVCFNSTNKLANVDDLDISGIILAQKEAIKSTRAKNKQIREAFEKINGKGTNGYTAYTDKIASRFKTDNQSLVNSVENLALPDKDNHSIANSVNSVESLVVPEKY
ncbi:uncharacterized protein RJT20DRAFT_147466 [Scheffersomyces xylosifermentans]|uniref:uncharacterized protein n=1 Tax=Scheffersomyces xylosifermentans TaxID=1304137 RepID=UPI00315C6287